MPLADATKALSRVLLRALLEDNRRYGWVPDIPLTAVIYPDELANRRHSLPRFIPEYVMGRSRTPTTSPSWVLATAT